MPAVTEELRDTTSLIEAVETGARRRVRNEELEYFWEQSDGSFLVEGSYSPSILLIQPSLVHTTAVMIRFIGPTGRPPQPTTYDHPKKNYSTSRSVLIVPTHPGPRDSGSTDSAITRPAIFPTLFAFRYSSLELSRNPGNTISCISFESLSSH